MRAMEARWCISCMTARSPTRTPTSSERQPVAATSECGRTGRSTRCWETIEASRVSGFVSWEAGRRTWPAPDSSRTRGWSGTVLWLRSKSKRDKQGPLVTRTGLLTDVQRLWAIGQVRSGFTGRLKEAAAEAPRHPGSQAIIGVGCVATLIWRRSEGLQRARWLGLLQICSPTLRGAVRPGSAGMCQARTCRRLLR